MKTFTKKNLEALRARNTKTLHHIHKLKESSIFFFSIAFAIIALTLFFHTFPKADGYKEVKQEIVDTNYELTKLKDNKIAVKNEAEKAEEVYNSLVGGVEENLAKILPPEESIGELTRFLEGYAVRFDQEDNPLKVNNISYGKAQLSPNKEYYVLPVKMNIVAGAKNFSNFLDLINRSGSIDEKDFFQGEPVRLMTIERINISAPIGEEEVDDVYSFNVEINTFYKPRSNKTSNEK